MKLNKRVILFLFFTLMMGVSQLAQAGLISYEYIDTRKFPEVADGAQGVAIVHINDDEGANATLKVSYSVDEYAVTVIIPKRWNNFYLFNIT